MLVIQNRLQPSRARAEALAASGRIAEYVHNNTVIICIIFFGFVMRYYLSLWKPYWYAELLSVVYYGSSHSSAFEAVAKLAARSIHPPLYQFILFYWIALFGDSEPATRLLSNLYVSGATLFLYVLVCHLHGRRLAIAAAIFFSLMFMPFYFAMVSRSYAQTLFLCSLSSLVLFYFIRSLPDGLTWKQMLLNRQFLYLSLVNAAALLTHYYNIFFLGAQGVFLLVYLLYRSKGSGLISTFAKVAAVTATPVVLMLAIWGPTMAHSYQRFSSDGKFATEAPSVDPWSIFVDFVVDPNFKLSPLVFATIAILLLVTFGRSAAGVYERRSTNISYRNEFTLYFAVWAFVPCVIAYILFFVSQAERYQDRYFIFCAPALAVLLALAIEEGVRLVSSLAGRFTGLRPARHYVRYAILYTLIAAVLLVVPQGQKAATRIKQDFRGIAAQIVSLVEGDPEHSYLVYEASHRRSLDYYFAKLSDDVRVHDTLKLSDEATGEFPFEQQASAVAQHDYLVVAFSYHRAWQFPQAVQRLSEHYGMQLKLLDRGGRGLMIVKIAP